MFSSCNEIIQRATHGGNEEAEVDEDGYDSHEGQDHLFAFYDDLSAEDRATLDQDFDGIRMDEIEDAWIKVPDHATALERAGVSVVGPTIMNWELKKPPMLKPGANLTKVGDVGERKRSGWRQTGLELYSRGRVAVVVLAGGGDTRMGDGLPKGTLDIGLLSHKSIFQLYIERVRRLQHLVYRRFRKAVYIPIYVMCSAANRAVTEAFFRENDHFGIREQDLMCFTQGMAPLCNVHGKFLLEDRHRIAMQPDGNGGVFRALLGQGMISDMKSRGVSSIYVCSVDNLLAQVGDPVFVGLCEAARVDAGLKIIERLTADEAVGVFCSKCVQKMEDQDGDGRLDAIVKIKAVVLEAGEVPDDLRKRRLQITSGLPPLQLSAANLSQYMFKVDFAKRVPPLLAKRWHVTNKSVPYLHLKTGQRVDPRGEKNAYRFEMYLFDAFEHTKSVLGLEVDREECAIVKSLYGEQSPATALMSMGKLHQSWILSAGGAFEDVRQSTEREDAKCEISPLATFAGEDLEGQFPDIIQLPFYLPSQQEMLEFSAASSAQVRRPSTHYLDWYSELAQRELEVELQGKLGHVVAAMEDPEKGQYNGDRAGIDEVLPPTPRADDQTALRKGKGKGKGADGADSQADGGKSPRGGRSPRGGQSSDGPKAAKSPEGSKSPRGGGASPRGGKKSPGRKGSEEDGEVAPVGGGRSKARDDTTPVAASEANKLTPLTAGAPKGTDKSAAVRSTGKDAGAAGGSLSKARGDDKPRDKYWGDKGK